MIKKIIRKLLCWTNYHHEWTCHAEQGIPATNEQLKSEKGFWEYARMYCKHCKKMSKLNKLIK
jgi:hypothetical protein